MWAASPTPDRAGPWSSRPSRRSQLRSARSLAPAAALLLAAAAGFVSLDAAADEEVDASEYGIDLGKKRPKKVTPAATGEGGGAPAADPAAVPAPDREEPEALTGEGPPSVGGGSTLGRGDAVAYALAGWPQESVGYLSGLSDDVDVGAEVFWQVPRANFEAAALLRYRLASRGRLDVAARGRVGFFVNLGGHGFERRNRDALGPVIGPGLALSYRAGARDLLYAGLDIPVGLGLDPAALHVPVLGSAGLEHELAKGLVDGKPLCVGLGTELGPWAVTRPDKLFFYWSAALRLTQAL